MEPRYPIRRARRKLAPPAGVLLSCRSGGRVWRIARRFDGRVVREISEGDLGRTVVLVFRAVGRGSTTVAFGVTRGETSKASESRRYVLRVR